MTGNIDLHAFSVVRNNEPRPLDPIIHAPLAFAFVEVKTRIGTSVVILAELSVSSP